MTRPNRRHSAEFRRQAVEFYLSVREFRTLGDVAEELGVHRNNLARWIKQAGAAHSPEASGNDAERAELARLRKENRILKEELEIAKKAHAFFARRES